MYSYFRGFRESFKPDTSYEIKSQFTHTQSQINAIRHENKAAVTQTSSFLQTAKMLLATDLGVNIAIDVSQCYTLMVFCIFRIKESLYGKSRVYPLIHRTLQLLNGRFSYSCGIPGHKIKLINEVLFFLTVFPTSL